MADVPDLSKLKNGTRPPAPEPEKTVARTAFLVVVRADGNIVVSIDTGQEVEVQHPCTTDDIYMAATLICKDIAVQQTAQAVQSGLLQMGSVLQQQTQDQQIRQHLNLK
jgi:hypothetical protein